MLWRNLVAKYSLLFVTLFIVLYTAFGLTVDRYQRNQLIAEAEEELYQSTVEIMTHLNEHTEEITQQTIQTLLALSDMDYQLITTEDQESTHFQVREFLTSLEQNNQIYLDKIISEQNELLIAGLRTDDFSLALFLPTDVIFNQLFDMRLSLIITLLLVLSLSVIVSYLLSRRLSKSLNLMKESTQQIILGKYDIKLPIQSHDELGEFAMSFNRMSRQLGNQLSALLQEKEILNSIIRSMRDGVMTMNLDGDVIISNSRADHFIADLNFEKGTVEGKPLSDQFDFFFYSVIEKGSDSTFQLTLQGRDWELLFTPLHKNNKIQGAVVIVRDVTEEKQLNQLRETFIANVSHELRTPISLIHGYSEAIIDEVAETVTEQRELANVIYDESERMSRLVSELLDLTKLKSGHLNLNKETHLIKPFLEKIKRKFSNAFYKTQVKFDLQIDEALNELSFDYDRLEQVLTNLIDNALKHTSEEGKITLKVIKKQRNVDFIVSDTGSGISTEDLPFVFERFYMADKARSKSEKSKKGTGLGLAIVKQIVEAHQGTINVQSAVNEGTIFKFNLPYKI